MMICSRCVLDTTDSKIVFDWKGECQYCKMFDEMWTQLPKGEEANQHLIYLMAKLKKDGEGKRYDALLGVSGGIDSTYAAYIAKQFGLRLLLVHSDNGFDSPASKRNIERILDETDYDYEPVKLDPDEFRDLTLAFMRAAVIDLDVSSDHAIVAVLWQTGQAKGIRNILSGGNQATEFYMPRPWTFPHKTDLRHLKNIHNRFGIVPLKTFPRLGIWKLSYLRRGKGIEYVYPLNYLPFNKIEVTRLLMKEWGWEPYGHKHCENIFTRFYQNYILPTRFGVDKRKAHFSALIRTGQITRDEALKELEKNPYEATTIYGVETGSIEQHEEDKAFVLGKLGLSDGEFNHFMHLPVQTHRSYGTDRLARAFIKSLRRWEYRARHAPEIIQRHLNRLK